MSVILGVNAFHALRHMMLLTDDERRLMGKRGRAWMVRDFSWASVAQRLQHCYDDASGLC